MANYVIILPKVAALMPYERLIDIFRDQYGHLSLADPEFDHPGHIDILIGRDFLPAHSSRSVGNYIHSWITFRVEHLTWLRYCGSCKRYGKRSTGLIVNKHGTID
jgi:hypothetical protein